ncbi:MAG TPA: endolytic transglycosylase MltG [Candidatus Paceibacterota bacterium]|nr:endolytic transglycosylase MltG [Candidatus Paceibacterota bacterium]
MKLFIKKNIIGAAVLMAVVLAAGSFFFGLGPANATASGTTVVFQVNTGDGFRMVAENLYEARLIRSPLAFDLFSLVDGRAFTLQPGLYRLSPSMDTPAIVAAISGGNAAKVTVTIPEGTTIFGIDRILSDALVIRPGTLVDATGSLALEGHLFPDTYQFYTDENVAAVVGEMTDNFNAKAAPLLPADPTAALRTLIIASIVQKEVPNLADQELVAGIIEKRLSLGMPLDIDATVCYAKLLVSQSSSPPSPGSQACTLTALDFKIDSPYNTYLYKGLPPGPIGNPGTSAITAALHPQSSPYLYYLTDPATGKTIFAKTLDEQNQNRVKYLESNQ